MAVNFIDLFGETSDLEIDPVRMVWPTNNDPESHSDLLGQIVAECENEIQEAIFFLN